jgi:hypothetical protein
LTEAEYLGLLAGTKAEVEATKLEEGRRRLRSLIREMGGKTPLIVAVMPAVEAAARRNAGMHPTPQSRIAATGLKVAGPKRTWLMVPKSSGLAGALGGGSEWGGRKYRQFGPPRGSPAWLGRVAEQEDPNVAQALDRAIESLMVREL